MQAFKCDKCGKLYENYTTSAAKELVLKMYHRSEDYTSPLDLCSDCANELRTWFGLPTTETTVDPIENTDGE